MSASGEGAKPPSRIGRQHFLCFLPLSQGQGSFGEGFKDLALSRIKHVQCVAGVSLKRLGSLGERPNTVSRYCSKIVGVRVLAPLPSEYNQVQKPNNGVNLVVREVSKNSGFFQCVFFLSVLL
jgi:hypothetical protein